MNNKSIYIKIEEARNGTKIPVFVSGRTMESRYNPERDAENLCNNTKDGRFFVILGIGSGLFIKHLSSKYPDAVILAVENSSDDIAFLRNLETIKVLLTEKNIFFCTAQEITQLLINKYLPAKYGNLQLIEQRGWVNEIPEEADIIKAAISKTLGIISADYSVQAHFGKIWIHNILENAKLIQKTKYPSEQIKKIENAVSENRTAVIIAAGPTLDSHITELQNEKQKNEIYLIATDTAWQSLLKHGIKADAVVSIDGQSVSYNHFLFNDYKAIKKDAPLFFFDLCSNSSAAKKIIQNRFSAVFFCSGHPLSVALKNFSRDAIPCFFSGAGTVTITAADIAYKAGFKKIKIYGADFSYSSGKPYTKGTYLDTLYYSGTFKTSTAEKAWCRLLYRTELSDCHNGHFSSSVLEAYRQSMEAYFLNNGIEFTRDNFIYEAFISTNNQKLNFSYSPERIDYQAFIKELTSCEPSQIEIVLLPYIAYLRQKNEFQQHSYSDLLKLAFSTIVSYNI